MENEKLLAEIEDSTIADLILIDCVQTGMVKKSIRHCLTDDNLFGAPVFEQKCIDDARVEIKKTILMYLGTLETRGLITINKD